MNPRYRPVSPQAVPNLKSIQQAAPYPSQLPPIPRIPNIPLPRKRHIGKRRPIPRIPRILKILKDLIKIRQPRLGQDPDRAYQAGNTPGRKRAAREAQQEDLVAGDVVVDDEVVGLADVFGETEPCAAADDAVVQADARADAGLVVDDLRDVRGGVGAEAAADARDVRGDLQAFVGAADGQGGFLDAVVGVEPGSCAPLVWRWFRSGGGDWGGK